ncbi:glycosyl transferase [Sphingobacterium faecium NBRC 15299]|uniref:glycosyltransferase family 4 protein n=1 Tax=Sphingobacterium faecium TaxID=34087 RepID=UPI000D3472DE|nr:glycosyltransferase family 4 protein [Sphingobacterium faecium]PTX12477.1 glycosyltransferase involved in cell wall biosynthesis [Sphingobacterium faecium]GEM62186.1 glycosyl transferase [Sphingobacterium faecium NBRC 15299]
MKKLIRVTTVPISLRVLLNGQLKFMSNFFRVIGISSPGEDLENVKDAEGITVVPVNMSRKITPIADLQSLVLLYKILKKEKPLIVHSHTPKAGIVGMLAAKLAGVPIRLHTVAGLPLMEATGVKRKILNFVEKLTYSSATKVYPNSKGLYDFILENNFIHPHKLKVIANGSSNGINTAHFSINQFDPRQIESLKLQLGINFDDFVFVFVGRLVGDKGINELVEAFKALESSVSSSGSIKLLLVGPLETELDPLFDVTLKEIQSNPNIISVGFQKDVRSYFAISDALVFPSYREGFPNVVMQAGAMGLPAIVSDINGCNEIIVEGENGMIIPVKNAKAIQEAMSTLLLDEDYFSILKLNARKMISERYEQQVVWDALLKEYKELIKDKGLEQ